MKKVLILSVALLLSVSVFGQITGSAHDFTSSGWNTTGELCITCHTPHNADTTVTDAPLWNHEVTVATFTVYSSGTLNANDLGQPDGVSKLCLSCHDGSVALDSFGGTTGTNPLDPASSGFIGTDLGNDHPVSFTYQAAIDNGDDELFATTASTSLGGTIASDLLNNGRLECSSCHDVHNRDGNSSLLIISNAGSALCLTCHDK
ncbi:MAG: cytochrome c3 family protein [bacterium]|nr:cytochrome c3 family protein [bacterium]